MNSNTNESNQHHHHQQQQTNTNVNPAQVQNYITWINSHLKKRPGVKLVENLHIDITNGVPLIHLIEVISGDVLTDVNLNPRTYNEYKENIDKVLRFMQLNSVKIARTTSKEILDGNIKSIMRVILALAAHFKPSNLQTAPSSTSSSCSTANVNNNRQSVAGQATTCSLNNLAKQQQQPNNVLTQQNSKNNLNSTRTITNVDSMTHLVQAACVSFADVRRYKNENFNVKYVRRNNLLLNGQPPTLSSSSSTITAKQQQQPLPKFNYPTNQVNGSNVADAAAAALPSDSTNIQIIEANSINNKTYVTNVVANSPPVSRYHHHHHHHNSNNKAGEPDENSFLNSVLLSPSSHQNPIASSTILGQTGLFHQAKQQMEFNKTYSKQSNKSENAQHESADDNQANVASLNASSLEQKKNKKTQRTNQTNRFNKSK